MIFCETCQDTGNCPCGATDCGPKPCPDCFCDSCTEAGKKLVGPGKKVCEKCAKEEIEARAEDARDDDRRRYADLQKDWFGRFSR